VAGFSWGRDGHRVVAKIAAKNLSPDARKKVAAILGTNEAGVEAAMASASIWPDEISKPDTKTDTWHFIDVPVTAPFSIGTLCAQHNCVIDRIQEMSDRLRMNQSGFKLAKPPIPSRPMTSQELAFLIHFVGDIHQPLHSANDGDRGGNCENLTNPIVHNDHSRDTTELHAAWDVDEVLAVFKQRGNEDATANALFQRFKNGAQVQQLTITDWARESNDLARTDVYKKPNIPNHTAPVGQCGDCESKCQPGISRRERSRCGTTAPARWNPTVENHKRYLRRERVRSEPGRRAPRGARVVRLPRAGPSDSSLRNQCMLLESADTS
ncbi:MAG: hypothetical protein DMG11_31080, partial [Acidobacteria bacterium]